MKIPAKFKQGVDLAKQFPIETDCYLCHIPADPDYQTAFGKGREAWWVVLPNNVTGYEQADFKTPYAFQDDLERYIVVSGDTAATQAYVKLKVGDESIA